jgi:hypothetical protein
MGFERRHEAVKAERKEKNFLMKLRRYTMTWP